jgi:hypothetical protein
MVSLHSFVAAARDTQQALSQIEKQIDAVAANPSLICIFYDADHDDAQIHAFMRAKFADVPVIGGTSCGGSMNQNGLGGPGSIGLLLIEDTDGDYGVGAEQLGEDVAGCAERALHTALENADCAGELPELIWIFQAPGKEEAVISGLRRIVGDRCPIIGGSSADNTVSGGWRQFGPQGPLHDSIVVAALFSSGGIGFAFQGGYEPAGASGVVTKVADGGTGIVTQSRARQIISIDGEPAAEVYNRWVGGFLSDKIGAGGNVLAETSMHPLGIDAGRIEEVTQYLVVHPEEIKQDGTLTTFAEIEEGTRLYSMRGDKARLVDRAGKVAAAAAAQVPGGAANLAGGLIVYCAGCKIAVGEQMEQVSHTISESFQGKPFIGCFTFGEQGFVLDRNAHGNLMISAIAFGR